MNSRYAPENFMKLMIKDGDDDDRESFYGFDFPS